MVIEVEYFCRIFRGETFLQFDLLSADVENTDNPLTVDYLHNGLVWYLFYMNLIKKKKASNAPLYEIPCGKKVRRYEARLIDLNGYLASFPGSTMADKMCVTELNEIILNSMPNSWTKQAYVQGFDCELI